MSLPPVRSIRTSLLLLSGAGLLPVLFLSGWGVWNAVVAHEKELERATLELSRALASAVESELEATFSSLDALGRSPSLAAGDVRAFYINARNEVVARPAWTAVVLTDANGRVLFRTSGPFGESDVKVVEPASLLRTIESRKPVVGDVARGDAQNPAFPVRVPILANGELRYVLTAAVKPDRILDLLTKQTVPKGWVIGVLDGSGKRVARSVLNASPQPSPGLTALLKQGGASGIGETRSLEGLDLYIGYTRLRDHGWVVAVGAPKGETRMALLQSLAFYFAGAAVSIALALAMSRQIARRISENIGRLRDQAVNLGAGLPVSEANTADSGIAEIEQMSQAMRAASARLMATSASMQDALSSATTAGKTKDDFLAVLGHELRNPLAPMLTALHLMDRKADESTVKERQILRRQVRHLQRLVDDLLDVSRITQGTLVIRDEQVDLRQAVQHAVEAVQPLTAGMPAGIETHLPDRAAWVRGDEARLVQAVTNLLTNAVRYGDGGAIHVRLTTNGSSASIRVSDNGVGIDADMLQRVFEPFVQGAQSLQRGPGGLGLGLAIVLSIVKLHGGTVNAHSAGAGQGTTLTITLPLVPEEAEEHVDPLTDGPSAFLFRPARVLLVDDNTDALELLGAAMESAGHSVWLASKPSEALAVIEGQRPDVAVLDIGLPEMDGYELAKLIRKVAPEWPGQLVALTGYGQLSDKERSQQFGFSRHLTKPVDLEQLLRAIDELLPDAAGTAVT